MSWFTLNKDLSVSALQFWLTGSNERGRVPPPPVLTVLAAAGTDPPPSHLQVNRKAVGCTCDKYNLYFTCQHAFAAALKKHGSFKAEVCLA